MATIFKIDFDLTSQEQIDILDYLQANNYKLLGYKGASGPAQVTEGVPVWFAEPFIEMFGNVEIDYEPLYKVYVYNKATIGAYTTIQMQALSPEVPLGTAVTFNADGSWSTIPDGAPDGIITLLNNRPAGTDNITVGLASKVNGEFAPFCAFTATPQGSISMEPNETVLLFAAQDDLVSGSVVGNTTAPGCTFDFNASSTQYDLQLLPSTFGIDNAPGGRPVTVTDSGTDLTKLLTTVS
ncbi:hypothetical protein [Aquimarina pacifica]|uniref:hypothetical protein n=1 Tax=Aquimarina pacifica TaxID=1296415 RepID=UPI00046F272D|nr:hypothetical protein [Aquimarina pacifica]